VSIIFAWHQGTSPLLISIPHDGRRIPPRIADRMTEDGTAIPDTDWHVGKLYEFARITGASTLFAKFSRYVVVLNRPADDAAIYEDQVATGLFPTKTFDGREIYREGETVSERQRERRLARYWRPWHAQLAESLERIRDHFGYALLWDAHSIRSAVPRLFDGELPDLSIGTNDGQSCPAEVEQAVAGVGTASPYSLAVNGRFKGGYATRHYGRPADGIFAIQLEIAQRTYMNEETLRYDQRRAARLADTLSEMLGVYQSSAARSAAAAGKKQAGTSK
jgi:N-formylglutamate amidohydrolase